MTINHNLGDNYEKKAIIVAGMHRSGTSALTRVLNLCGVTLPNHLLDPQDDNQTGFWESSQIVNLHDQILASAGSSWHDLSVFPQSWFTSITCQEFEDTLLNLLKTEFESCPFFVIKDPRICRLIPLWLKVLKRFETTPYFIIVVRHPIEVAESLKKRDQFSLYKGILLWLQHFLQAERDTRNQKRVFMTYEQLLQNWTVTMDVLEKTLDISFPKRSPQINEQIQDFLNPNLRHHHKPTEEVYNPLTDIKWVSLAYQWATQTRQGETPSFKELDQIYHSFIEADSIYSPMIYDLENRLTWEQEQQLKLKEAHETIKAMQSSKFWKLRTFWFKIKSLLKFTR